jgi:type I site-specific restriction endonuclease
MSTEADTCRKLVTPKLQAAGWDTDSHSIAEQRFAETTILRVDQEHASEIICTALKNLNADLAQQTKPST